MTDVGDAVFTTIYATHNDRPTGEVTGFRIDRADRFIKISAELVDEWRKGSVVTGESSVTLHDNDVVHIHALNGTVTYRLGEKVDHDLCFMAERVACTVEFPT